MKHLRIFLMAMLLMTAGNMRADMPREAPFFELTLNGVTLHLEFLTDNIVHVRRFPHDKVPPRSSYSVVLDTYDADIHTSRGDGATTINTLGGLQVVINQSNGRLTFKDTNGHVLLSETAGTVIEPCANKVDLGKFKIGQTWTLDADEDIYGLGQLRDKTMSWRGQDKELWNNNTYIAIPYVCSSKGYGLYWDNAGRSHFSDGANGMTFTSEVATCLNYYFMYKDGSHDGLMALVRKLGGQATMFPLWTMGYWQCRERYKTSDELAEVLDRYRELHIPLDGIVQDWQYWGCDSNWNAMKFQNPYYINKVGDPAWDKYLPDDLKKLAEEYKAKGLEPRLKSPDEMVDYVHSNNAHLMISIWANFGPWTEPYKKLKEIGALMPFDTWPREKGVMPYDPFNPKARDIYWQSLTNLYNMGFDAWWTDSTEPDHFEKAGDEDYMTHDGSWRSVKNAFPLMTNGGIYEHQRAAEALKIKQFKNYIGKRSVQMTRSGTFGIQRYGTFSWSGDVNSTWDEMKNQIPSGLNFVLCGIPFWNTDLGGFFYWECEPNPKNPAVKELQTRWVQWGTFMPLMRNHSSSPMTTELYTFGSEGDWAYDAMADAIRLRYRLLPYIYAQAGAVVQHSGMMMRPLVMDFANDVTARRLNDEYMFGHALLVKPVTDPMFTRREGKKGFEKFTDMKTATGETSVYLPNQQAQGSPTKWYDFYTNKLLAGGQTIQRSCTINDMPVYVRAGSILPFGPEVQYSGEKAWDDLEIRVYPGADGEFTLYEDEGDGYGYEQGRFSEITFHWDNAKRELTITGRNGKFKGMLKKRTFRIVLVSEQSPRGDRPMPATHTVEYSGRQTRIAL